MYKYAFTFKLTLKNRQWNQVYCNVRVAPFHTYTRDTNRWGGEQGTSKHNKQWITDGIIYSMGLFTVNF